MFLFFVLEYDRRTVLFYEKSFHRKESNSTGVHTEYDELRVIGTFKTKGDQGWMFIQQSRFHALIINTLAESGHTHHPGDRNRR